MVDIRSPSVQGRYVPRSTQRPERRPHLLGEHLRLFPGREVAALRQPVVVDQLGIGALRPAARSGVDLVREDADPDRQVDTLRREERRACSPSRGEPRRSPSSSTSRASRCRGCRPSSDPRPRRRRRGRSATGSAHRGRASTPRGRRVNPRARTGSAGGSPSPARSRVRACRRSQADPTRTAPPRRDRAGVGRRTGAPSRCRPGSWQPCSYGCRAIPSGVAAPSVP